MTLSVCVLCGTATTTRGELCLRCSPLVTIPKPRTREELGQQLLAERYDLPALAHEAFDLGAAP